MRQSGRGVGSVVLVELAMASLAGGRAMAYPNGKLFNVPADT